MASTIKKAVDKLKRHSKFRHNYGDGKTRYSKKGNKNARRNK